MPSFTSFTAALAFTATVIATPIDKRSGFSVQQVQRKIFAKNGPRTMVKTLRKYGKPVPAHILQAAENGLNDEIFTTADNGSVPAVPQGYDISYLSPITIGTNNPTTVQVDFDTGSGDLWVFSSLQASTQLSGHDYYRVDSSKQISGASWKISYGDGSGASGKVYADKVVVGGVTATSQAVEAATSVSAEFSADKDTDGLLGLSFSSLNTVRPKQQKTFFDTVIDSLPEPLFAVTLKYRTAGTYDFGFLDSTKYTGDITYTDVDTSQGFWQFSFSGYTIGNGTETETTINGIADTGTTLVYLPVDVVEAYYAKVPGATINNSAGGYVMPCSTIPPNFSFTLNGVKLCIPGKYINFSVIQEGSSTCFGGIQTNEGIGLNIFGDVFLKSKYVVHEQGSTPRIGFAAQSGL